MTMRPSILPAALLAAALAQSGAAHAATISYADAMSVLARDCGADVEKYCKGLNIGNNRIADCLAANQARISPVCAATIVAVRASIQTRLTAQANVAEICRGDARRRCTGVVQKDAYVLDCLVKAARTVSQKCNEAITDAGWR